MGRGARCRRHSTGPHSTATGRRLDGERRTDSAGPSDVEGTGFCTLDLPVRFTVRDRPDRALTRHGVVVDARSPRRRVVGERAGAPWGVVASCGCDHRVGVPRAGLEPARTHVQRLLRPRCLPVPPPGHGCGRLDRTRVLLWEFTPPCLPVPPPWPAAVVGQAAEHRAEVDRQRSEGGGDLRVDERGDVDRARRPMSAAGIGGAGAGGTGGGQAPAAVRRRRRGGRR